MPMCRGVRVMCGSHSSLHTGLHAGFTLFLLAAGAGAGARAAGAGAPAAAAASSSLSSSLLSHADCLPLPLPLVLFLPLPLPLPVLPLALPLPTPAAQSDDSVPKATPPHALGSLLALPLACCRCMAAPLPFPKECCKGGILLE